MINDQWAPARDDYLLSVTAAKNAASVVKTEFSQWISEIPRETKIFALEGVNDKNIYYHWLKKIAPGFLYEAFQCGNKDKVLQLYDALKRDRSDLGKWVFYFVDRDFDDLQGRDPSPRIFMTDKYAIENYLVTSEVLNDILSVELHCNGAPNVRQKIVNLFERVFDQHLDATQELNFRAYAAKVLRFARLKPYPERINQISKVELCSVKRLAEEPSKIIVWQRELTAGEEINLRDAFAMLEPRTRYRGKFAFCFLIKWLELLRSARQSPQSDLFSPLSVPANKIFGNFSMETIAPKAPPPAGLQAFLATALGLPMHVTA